MDTILYFYKKRGLREPLVEPVGLKAYMLVRVALDACPGEWFGRKLEPVLPERSAEDAAEDQETLQPQRLVRKQECLRSLLHPLGALRRISEKREKERREKNLRLAMEREEEQRLAAKEKLLAEVEASMRKLSLDVEELVWDRHDCFCVYEDSLRKVLVRESPSACADTFQEEFPKEADTVRQAIRMQKVAEILPALWGRYFQQKEFCGYAERFWVERLLSEAALPHFVILGTAPCIFSVIEACARRMKSLRWILPEKDCGEELWEFTEGFCIEYGLAVSVQPIENLAALKRLRLGGAAAVNILDFTARACEACGTGKDSRACRVCEGREASGVPSEIPGGSIWLDIFSVEEKRRRIMAKAGDVTYFSLKEIWKSAQKRCSCPILLDTAPKQRYNTVGFGTWQQG